MGGSQSSRKISVDNENAIQVSQEALDRIQSQLKVKNSNQQSTRPAPPPPSPPPVEQPFVAPSFYYEQKRQDYAAEEAYWSKRIDNLKRAHDIINADMDVEYQKTLKEANELFDRASSDKFATRLPPCQEEQAKVLQCYSVNQDQSLLCSVLVNQFNDCVCKSRISAVSASS